MEELLRFINEYDAKHNDTSWCNEFANYCLSHAEEIEANNNLPDDFIDKFENAFKNTSDGFKIEHNDFEDITITDEILSNYKDNIISSLKSHVYLSSSYSNNPLMLKFCLDNDILDKIPGFDNSLFTLDLLRQYRDKFINIITDCNDNQINSLNRLNIYENVDVLKFCLENNMNDVIDDILLSNKITLTIELLNEYHDKFVELFNKKLYSYRNNKDVFVFCLQNNILANTNILLFDKSFYTKELMDQYKEAFVNALNSIYVVNFPKELLTTDILEFCLENSVLSLSAFFANGLITNKALLDKNKDNFIEYLNKESHYYFEQYVAVNPIVLEFSLENCVDRVIEIYLKKDPSLFTEEILIKYGDSLKGFFDRAGVPDTVRQDYNLVKFCINKDIINVGMDKELAIYKIDYLYNINDELLSSIDFRILKYDFDLAFLSKITLYSDIQKKIIDLDPNKLSVFYRVAKTINNSSIDLSSIIVKFLDNIAKYEHILENIDVNSLSDRQIMNFLEMIEINCDYGITNAKELEDDIFKKKKNDYFTNFGKEIGQHSIDEIQEAIFQKQYGIDLEQAKFILARYEYDYEDLVNSGLDKKVLNTIFGIKTIVECTSASRLSEIYEQIDQVQSDYLVFTNLESEIRKRYAEMYNNTYYKITDSSTKCNNPLLQNVSYEGTPITFYEPNGDFSMQIHALGAYRDFERPDSFKDSWNRPKIAYHGICTSYINNSEIATARAYHPILGFSEYEDSALLLGGNYDLFSDHALANYDASSFLPYKILPPKTMIDATRHNHNEMVIERCKNNSSINKTAFKRQPNYIVYIVDTMDNKDNFSLDNPVYSETLQAARDFNLPVVILDRTKIANRELEKCNNLEEEFIASQDLSKLNEALITYFNNNVGARFFSTNEEIVKNMPFSDERVTSFYNRIIHFTLNMLEDSNQKLVILNDLKNMLLKEEKNYSVKNYIDKSNQPFNFNEAIEKLNIEINKIENSLQNVENNEYEEEINTGRSM